jgi:hypothetical protein
MLNTNVHPSNLPEFSPPSFPLQLTPYRDSDPSPSRNNCGFGLYVPQRAYQPQRTGYLHRNTEPFHSEDPITFSVDGRSGILARDALESEFSGFDRGHDQMVLNKGAPISLRFEVYGLIQIIYRL